MSAPKLKSHGSLTATDIVIKSHALLIAAQRLELNHSSLPDTNTETKLYGVELTSNHMVVSY